MTDNVNHWPRVERRIDLGTMFIAIALLVGGVSIAMFSVIFTMKVGGASMGGLAIIIPAAFLFFYFIQNFPEQHSRSRETLVKFSLGGYMLCAAPMVIVIAMLGVVKLTSLLFAT